MNDSVILIGRESHPFYTLSGGHQDLVRASTSDESMGQRYVQERYYDPHVSFDRRATDAQAIGIDPIPKTSKAPTRGAALLASHTSARPTDQPQRQTGAQASAAQVSWRIEDIEEPPTYQPLLWDHFLRVGSADFDLLKRAQSQLWERLPTYSHYWWRRGSRVYTPRREFCHSRYGLLYRVSSHPDVICSADFNHTGFRFGRQGFERSVLGFHVGMNTTHRMIINDFLTEYPLDAREYGLQPTNPNTTSASAPQAWPNLVFDMWSELSAQTGEEISSLEAVLMGLLNGPTTGPVTDAVIWFLEQRDPRLPYNPANLQAPRIVRYTPEEDNFYALLATDPGRAVMELLLFHANSFATRNAQTGIVEKIKTIRDIRLSAQPDEVFRMYDMYVTLEDIDPYPGMDIHHPPPQRNRSSASQTPSIPSLTIFPRSNQTTRGY